MKQVFTLVKSFIKLDDGSLQMATAMQNLSFIVPPDVARTLDLSNLLNSYSEVLYNQDNAQQPAVVVNVVFIKSSGGGGGGGTTNYNALSNKPQIEGVELAGNKLATAFGLATETYVLDELSKLGHVLKFRGIVATFADLPSVDNKAGDVWLVGDTADSTTNLEEYVWVVPVTDPAKFERLGISSSTINIQDSHIGQVYNFNGLLPNSEILGLLPCIGQTLQKIDYPELYTYYKDNNPSLIINADSFKLPTYDSSNIVKTGSNPYGTWIDYADGTRILHGYTDSIYSSATYDLTFPTPFATPFYFVVSLLPMDKYTSSLQSLYGQVNAFYSSNHRVNKMAVTFGLTASASPPYAVRYIIVGKWNTNLSTGYEIFKFIKAKNIVKDRQYIVAEPELNVHYLALNSLIKFQGKLYTCVKDTTWDGTLNADWKEYSPTPDTSKFVQADGSLTNGKIWKGTKAEYDAIVTKDPNTVYLAEDNVPDPLPITYVDKYELTETLTNKTWLGKKVYRKCIIYTLTSLVGNQKVAHNINNIDQFVNISGIWHASTSYPLPFVYTNAPEQVGLSADGINISVIVGVNRAGTTARLVLEYTCTDR